MQRLEKLAPKWVWIVGVSVFVLIAIGGFWWFNQHQNQTLLQANETLLNTSSQSASSHARTKSATSTQKKPQKSLSAKTLYVEIKGAVNRPGIYQLPVQARLNDLIVAAGDVLPEAETRQLNLAQRLKDEASFYVPTKGEKIDATKLTVAKQQNELAGDETQPDGEVATETSVSKAKNKVNLNTATLADLQTLTGIGPKKAEEILNYRQKNGRFKTIDELKEVSGIGDKTFATLQAEICV